MIPSNILKINILYSNYPNPIVIERIKKLKENNVNVKVTFANRKGNINKLNFDKSICDHQIINSKQLKKFNLNRWFLVIKFFNVINKDDYDVYPIYPDMLLSAFIFKLFTNSNSLFCL